VSVYFGKKMAKMMENPSFRERRPNCHFRCVTQLPFCVSRERFCVTEWQFCVTKCHFCVSDFGVCVTHFVKSWENAMKLCH